MELESLFRSFNKVSFQDVAKVAGRIIAIKWLLSPEFTDWGHAVIGLELTPKQLAELKKHFYLPDP